MDFTDTPDQELAETVAAAQAELTRRAVLSEQDQRVDDMCLDYLRAEGRENGGLYEPPAGFLGAYPRGWRVNTPDGVFEAVQPGTVTAPPSDDWVPVDPDEPVIPFWEPGPHRKGDQARDAGRVWTALSDGDGPRPSEFPGGWAAA